MPKTETALPAEFLADSQEAGSRNHDKQYHYDRGHGDRHGCNDETQRSDCARHCISKQVGMTPLQDGASHQKHNPNPEGNSTQTEYGYLDRRMPREHTEGQCTYGRQKEQGPESIFHGSSALET